MGFRRKYKRTRYKRRVPNGEGDEDPCSQCIVFLPDRFGGVGFRMQRSNWWAAHYHNVIISQDEYDNLDNCNNFDSFAYHVSPHYKRSLSERQHRRQREETAGARPLCHVLLRLGDVEDLGEERRQPQQRPVRAQPVQAGAVATAQRSQLAQPLQQQPHQGCLTRPGHGDLQPQRVQHLVLVGAHGLDVRQPRAVRGEQHRATQQRRLGLAQSQRAHGRAHAEDGAHQVGVVHGGELAAREGGAVPHGQPVLRG